MQVATVREFRRKLSQLLGASEPVAVLRYDKVVAFLFPQPEKTLGPGSARKLLRELEGVLRSRVRATFHRERGSG